MASETRTTPVRDERWKYGDITAWMRAAPIPSELSEREQAEEAWREVCSHNALPAFTPLCGFATE